MRGFRRSAADKFKPPCVRRCNALENHSGPADTFSIVMADRSHSMIRMLGYSATLAIAAAVAPRTYAQTIAPAHASNLTITNIGSAYFNTGANSSRVTQMAFGPGP